MLMMCGGWWWTEALHMPLPWCENGYFSLSADIKPRLQCVTLQTDILKSRIPFTVPCFFSFPEPYLPFVSCCRSDTDITVKNYCQTVYPEMHLQHKGHGTIECLYLDIYMLGNWGTTAVILSSSSPWICTPVVVFQFELLDWSGVSLGDNTQQNMVNMFHVTLQFPFCQSVQQLYLSYCSARLTAHDRSSSRLAAEKCDYKDRPANTCINASETYIHLLMLCVCTNCAKLLTTHLGLTRVQFYWSVTLFFVQTAPYVEIIKLLNWN